MPLTNGKRTSFRQPHMVAVRRPGRLFVLAFFLLPLWLITFVSSDVIRSFVVSTMRQCIFCILEYVSLAYTTSSYRLHSSRRVKSLDFLLPVYAFRGLRPPAGYLWRRLAHAVWTVRYLVSTLLCIFSSRHVFSPEQSLITALAATSGAEAATAPSNTDIPFLVTQPLPKSPTLYQEEQPLPFLRERTLFLVANEPVLESHVASNLLHQLLYALQVPNEHVWLLDELLLQGPHNEKYTTLLPWLVYTYHNLPSEVEFIWIGTAYSRVVGRALEELLRRLHDARTFQEQQERLRQQDKEDRKHESETAEQHRENLSQAICVGFGLRDVTSSPRHHYFSDTDFTYPFLSAGLLLDRHFLHFLAQSVHDSAEAAHSWHQQQSQQRQKPQQNGQEGVESGEGRRRTVMLPPRIEIDPVHELFKFLYDKHKFQLTHSDLFCPDNPTPRAFDRTEIPYPASHRRQRRPSPARTLFDITGRSTNKNYTLGTERQRSDSSARDDIYDKKEKTPQLAALRDAEANILSCVTFTVGSRHSPILSHHFFDRLMNYEEEKIVRKEKLTQKLPIDSLLEPDSPYQEIEDRIGNERPFFIVEPEDVFVAVKTHDANLERRLPLLKELWASQKALAAAAKQRALQSHHAIVLNGVSTQGDEQELEALQDNMQQLRIVFFADSEATGKPQVKNVEENEGLTFEGSVLQTEEHDESAVEEDAGTDTKPVHRSQKNGEKGSRDRGSRTKRFEPGGKRAQRGFIRKEREEEENILRVPVPYPNEKRSLCEKMVGIMKHFYFKEKRRRFLVIADDDTLINVRHLLDIVSLALQPPIPARIFFRQALTDGNAIREAHAPYHELAAAIDDFMLPWKREYALQFSTVPPAAAADGSNSSAQRDDAAASASNEKGFGIAAGKGGKIGGSKHETKHTVRKMKNKYLRKQMQEQLRERSTPSSEVARSYTAATYAQSLRDAPFTASANVVSPLYLGERYSFGHTAARYLQSVKNRSDKDRSSNSKLSECSGAGGTKTAPKGKGVGTSEMEEDGSCQSSRGESNSSNGPSPSLSMSRSVAPSPFSAVNDIFSLKGYSYITGGGGIVLDRAAVRLLLNCPRCKCPADGTADDMLLGLWLQNILHVPSLHAPGFHQERPHDYHAAHVRQITPSSFHRLDRDPEITRRNFQKYVQIGEGLNVGKFEEDDFQFLDWVDHDWQQVEDLLWHESDDSSSDWLLNQYAGEEGDLVGTENEDETIKEDEEFDEPQDTKGADEKEGGGGTDAKADQTEMPVEKTRKKSGRVRFGREKVDLDLSSLIHHILDEAKGTQKGSHFAQKGAAQRSEKKREVQDSKGDTHGREDTRERRKEDDYRAKRLENEGKRQEEL